MKKLILLACVALCSAVSFAQNDNDWTQFYRYADANAAIAAEGKAPVAVLMGDSITDNWLRFNPQFFTDHNFAGRGISGQVTAQMLARFRADVVDLHPKYVAILAGTNDIAMNNGPVTLEHIMDNIKSMCEIARANKIKVVLCSVLPASAFSWRPQLSPAEDIKTLNSMMKEYAAQKHLIYLDYWTLLANEKGGLSPERAGDGVHPNLDTYHIMEAALLKALGIR